MLVRPQLEVSNFSTHAYSDGSGHVLQILRIGRIAFANTHIKWASASTAEHVGIGQARELLDQLGPEQPAVLFADSNDSFGGPVRQLVERAGFTDISGDKPTALVDQKLVDLDVLAVRGVSGRLIPHSYDIHTIPSSECPSDHIPIVAEIEIDY